MSQSSEFASHEDACMFLQVLGVEVGAVSPDLSHPAIPGHGALGTCCICLRPVQVFAARWAGWMALDRVILAHWECATATEIALWESRSPEGQVEEVPSNADVVAYQAALADLRTATLYSILCEYQNALSDDQMPGMVWKIRVIQKEFESRMDTMSSGHSVAVDEQLRDASDRVGWCDDDD